MHIVMLKKCLIENSLLALRLLNLGQAHNNNFYQSQPEG
jgi:hypothetical protein